MSGSLKHHPLSVAGLALLLGLAGCDQFLMSIEQALPWVRHTIDDRFSGADGVKLGDVNDDGLTDLVVAWEESGLVVVYLNPGPAQATGSWPAVTVGRVASVEDAVFVDLDDDGALDVVSCCQGDVQSMYVHWAPLDPHDRTDPDAWQTAAIPATAGAKWIFCQPAQIDGDNGVDLVAGAKGDAGQIGYLVAPASPRDLSAWTWNRLADAAWVMSVMIIDLDADGDLDIVYTDRKGERRGAHWLENPTRNTGLPLWREHLIGLSNHEVMFADLGDLDGDGQYDLVAATQRRALLHFQPAAVQLPWLPATISWPESFGTGKSVRIGDVDLDGSQDIVFSCEDAGGKNGVGWLRQQDLGGLPAWSATPISDSAGRKFDLVQLVDLDADGDLDVITTEESVGLGVVWYENPTIMR